MEGCLVKARDTYEEKKLRLIANFYTQITFRGDISPASANHYLNYAEKLSYRQFCIMAFSQHAHGSNVRSKDYRGEELSEETSALLQEIIELQQLGLLVSLNPSTMTGAIHILTEDIVSRLLAPNGQHGRTFLELFGLEGMEGMITIGDDLSKITFAFGTEMHTGLDFLLKKEG